MPRFGSGADLARELGLSRVAIHKAEKAGRISRTASGEFDLDAAAIQYNLHTDAKQRRAQMARQGAGATAATEGPATLNELRTRRDRAETERVEIELAVLKGTLGAKETIESDGRRAGFAIVGSLAQLPDRIAAECGADDAQRRKIRQVAQREIDRVRQDVADAIERGTQ
jgi:hypothetical protein